MMLGPGRCNITAGGLGSRQPPAQATLASVRWHGLGAVQRLTAHRSISGSFPAFPAVH
eukprot:COSAG02_NODE_57898_length_279_cov_0.577778_1_plen_57_part_10